MAVTSDGGSQQETAESSRRKNGDGEVAERGRGRGSGNERHNEREFAERSRGGGSGELFSEACDERALPLVGSRSESV